MASELQSTTATLRIAVLSDLHAYDSLDPHEACPSFYCTREPADKNPINSLFELITSEQLTAHLVLCAGDIGDKARPAPTRDAWIAVSEVGRRLGADLVAGTVGNHDVDSRHMHNAFDPKGNLQALAPAFPLPDEDQNDRFWSRHFEIIGADTYRLVVLNSCAFHGGPATEQAHGRISEPTLNHLRRRLAERDAAPVNVLLCHHHPLKHMDYELGEYDEMAGGQLLLEMLGSGAHGQWIVIHGHKHHPKLRYAHGGGAAPVIFSAGSLCSTLYPQLVHHSAQQFYIIEFPLEVQQRFGMVGTFQTWNWSFGHGWSRAGDGPGLPGRGGFGLRVAPAVFANQVAGVVGTGVLGWRDFLDRCPEYQYLLPADEAIVLSTLRERHNLGVQYQDGAPIQIGQRA